MAVEAYLLGGHQAEVDDTTSDIRTPVGDRHVYGSPIRYPGDAHDGPEWECAVGGSELPIRQRYPAGCSGSVLSGPVEAGHPLLWRFVSRGRDYQPADQAEDLHGLRGLVTHSCPQQRQRWVMCSRRDSLTLPNSMYV